MKLKLKLFTFCFLLSISFTACGQAKGDSHKKKQKLLASASKMHCLMQMMRAEENKAEVM